jgi:RNA polymerase sigma factor (sigma-70 family)
MSDAYGEQECIMFLPNSTNRIVVAAYSRHNKALRAFLKCRLKSRDIDDVAQEVYLRLVRHPRLDKIEVRFPLLCKIASDIIKDRYRKQSVRKEKAHISFDEHGMISPVLSPEQMLESKEGVSVIENALKSLNRKSRKAIILHRFGNMTYKQIGMEMNISISMVRKHILHALQHITKKIEKYYGQKTKKAL